MLSEARARLANTKGKKVNLIVQMYGAGQREESILSLLGCPVKSMLVFGRSLTYCFALNLCSSWQGGGGGEVEEE
jgi:hypothetical protein